MITMKKITVVAFMAILLLTGCGKVDEKAGTEQGANSQTTKDHEKIVARIRITETGGEDGRKNAWDIFQIDGCNIVIQKDNRSCKTATYHISDEDYHALVDIDLSPYIGKTEDTEGITDQIYSNISIVYEDGTQNKIEVNIPELWSKLYGIKAEYDPFPESGNIGEYAYKTFNLNGYSEADLRGIEKNDKCFYLEKADRRDSPLQIYIYGGEYSHGGYFMYVTNLKIENNTLFIVVNEDLYEAEVYTEALMYTGCMVEIDPEVSNVIVKTQVVLNFRKLKDHLHQADQQIVAVICISKSLNRKTLYMMKITG